MCDLYSAECAGGCGATIEIHIADACTERANVHPYCPECVRGGLIMRRVTQKERGVDWRRVLGGKCASVFTDLVSFRSQIDRKDMAVCNRGDVVVILCDDPEAYGIHLN